MNTTTFLRPFAVLALLLPLSMPLVASANVGVGIGSGKITVQQLLHPGGTYTLPAVPVLNTGDETSQYAMDIEYLQDQPQKEPPQGWFTFTPGTFSLEPEKSQVVNVTLSVPVGAKPGDYFAYIEVHPVVAQQAGISRVGIAAASKLYFTVAPANIFEGVYYRALSFFRQYAPWSYVVLGLIALVVLVAVIRRFVSFNIGISVKK